MLLFISFFRYTMIYNNLLNRLQRLDEDASLLIDSLVRYRVIIVGGSALILLGRLDRATHDIDMLSVPQQLYALLDNYDINTNAEAYINNFPYNFEDRLIKLPLEGACIDYYTPSIEDLVIAKLYSFRDTDLQDIENPAVRESLNWDLLAHLATDDNEAKASALNDRVYQEFLARYETYIKRWRPCEN